MAHKRLMAVFVVAALAAAACGGDDETSTTDAATPTTAAAETTAPADTEPADTEPAADTTAPADTAADTTAPATDESAFVVDTEACEDPDAANAVIEGDIKIGTSIPLTGGPAALFAPFADGFQAYFDYINATEGGVNGQTLVPIVKDDQYTADITKTNVDSLVFDDEVALLSGIIGSPNNAAIQADMNALCVPQLWAATGAPSSSRMLSTPGRY